MVSPESERGRQARLRAEAAPFYPGMPVGRWLSAATVADIVWALRLERGEGLLHLGHRVLEPEHFEFRSGSPPGPGGEGRRASDRQGEKT